MNVADLPGLPTEEGAQVEFSLTTEPLRLAQTVAAMLNSGGGLLLIGYDEDATLVGVPGDANAELLRLREGIEKDVLPREPLQIVPVEGNQGTGLLIEVPDGAQKPYLAEGVIYVRRGRSTVRATPREISHLITRRGKAEERWERRPAVGMGAEVLSDETIRTAYESAQSRLDLQEPPDSRLETALEGLHLVTGGWPTNGAVALFIRSDDVAQHMPQARAQVVRFEEESPEGPIERIERSGGAAVLIEPLMEAVVRALPRIMVLPKTGVRREDRPTYPETAIREGLLNALMHRDYDDDGFVSVRLFPGRIEIWNPGKMDAAFLAGDDARLVSRPPNPDIARVFNLLKYGEGTGIGLWRIRTAMADAGLPVPTWENQVRGVLLTLRSESDAASATTSRVFSPRQAAFVRETVSGERFTRSSYQERFAPDVSNRTANGDIRGLIDSGYLRQEGSGRTTEYVRTSKTYHPADEGGEQ